MTFIFPSSSFPDDPFLNNSHFTISDLLNAAMNARKRYEDSQDSSGNENGKRELTFVPRYVFPFKLQI